MIKIHGRCQITQISKIIRDFQREIIKTAPVKHDKHARMGAAAVWHRMSNLHRNAVYLYFIILRHA